MPNSSSAPHLPYEWLSGNGPLSSIVLSSRLRAARNLMDYPFPYRATHETKNEILFKVTEAAKDKKIFSKFRFIQLEKISPLERQVLVENYQVSPHHIQDPQGRGLLQNENGTISIMINEEDHLRMQCFLSGLNLEQSWTYLNQIDDAFEAKLSYAFQEHWGYLSAYPTNLGTGLRASTLVHLPALTFLQSMPRLVHSLNQLGLVVRGFYGEGTESQGYFYQVSNALSIGMSEEDIVSRVSSVTRQIIDQELHGRQRLKKEQPLLLSDRISRALGILKSARIMNSMEAIEHLSLTRLGVAMEILPPIPMRILNELILMTRPANLQKYLHEEPNPAKRDSLRADYLRQRLSDFNW